MAHYIFRLGVSALMGCLFAVGAQTACPSLFGGKFLLIAGLASLGIFVLHLGSDGDRLRHP